MALRPYWSGQIRLSLVSLNVNIYSALNGSRTIALHEIYKPTGQRVRHQNVVDGEPIDRKDIVKGFEVDKDQYVILEPEEIKNPKLPSTKVLEITQFVDRKAIDDVYIDAPYFVAPDGKSAEGAFSVIREALRATGKVGLGQLTISGRERLCALKPCGSGMMLETLRYHEEVRSADPYFGDLKETGVDKEELELAKELIKRKAANFKPEQFHDHYKEALQELIDAKREHRSPKDVVEDKPASHVINLMDALRKSLQNGGDAEGDEKPTHRGAATKAKTHAKTKARTKTATHGRKAG
jgi:DNA end-binding protein Ku